jgi:cytochrome b561
MLRNDDTAWGVIARLLHWGMALLMLAQFALGWLAKAWHLSPTKLQLFVWHKSFGIVLLVLVALRLAWRLANTTPAPPARLVRWQHHAARASHGLLYLLMIAIPVTGWAVNSAANIPFKLFWLFALPDITAPSQALEEIAKRAHLALTVTLSATLAAHIAAALHHHFARHTDVLRRMLVGKSART